MTEGLTGTRPRRDVRDPGSNPYSSVVAPDEVDSDGVGVQVGPISVLSVSRGTCPDLSGTREWISVRGGKVSGLKEA